MLDALPDHLNEARQTCAMKATRCIYAGGVNTAATMIDCTFVDVLVAQGTSPTAGTRAGKWLTRAAVKQ